MEQRVPLPRPAKDFNTAKRLYMEQLGSALVTNNYLKVALAGVSLVAVGLIVLNIRTYQTFENFKPLVIRISDIGRAEALSYDSFQYTPQDAEIRYFLIQFVTKHYSRRRATIREAYAESLYFLDGRLADAAIEANRKSKTIGPARATRSRWLSRTCRSTTSRTSSSLVKERVPNSMIPVNPLGLTITYFRED